MAFTFLYLPGAQTWQVTRYLAIANGPSDNTGRFHRKSYSAKEQWRIYCMYPCVTAIVAHFDTSRRRVLNRTFYPGGKRERRLSRTKKCQEQRHESGVRRIFSFQRRSNIILHMCKNGGTWGGIVCYPKIPRCSYPAKVTVSYPTCQHREKSLRIHVVCKNSLNGDNICCPSSYYACFHARHDIKSA